MRSERQIQASRANGAKSRGPKTSEGKRASSRNALTHGMLAETIVLEGESEVRFLALLAALHEELQPRTPVESSLVDNMAVARWRQMRVWALEKAAIEHEIHRQSAESQPAHDSATRAALAFRALSDGSRSLELINRYESRYDRHYLRAHRRFLELCDRRTPPPVQPLQPLGAGSDPAPPRNEKESRPDGPADSCEEPLQPPVLSSAESAVRRRPRAGNPHYTRRYSRDNVFAKRTRRTSGPSTRSRRLPPRSLMQSNARLRRRRPEPASQAGAGVA